MAGVASQRQFSLVLWGSSGFTGKLVAEHLMQSYANQGIRWAMAGRNKEKLERVRNSLAKKYGIDEDSIPILVGDINNPLSLDSIASNTDVIVSTAGPFAKYGTPLLESVVKNKCDYVDITGETPWICDMAQKYHQQAAADGIRIIHCCGYDSIPSDMGAWTVVQKAKELGKTLKSVTSVNVKSKGGVSGGTIASGMNIAADPSNKGKDISSYAYIPDKNNQPRGSDTDVWTPVYCKHGGGMWLAPFIMQAINSRVVQRSNYLLNWGKDGFSYSEHIRVASRFQAWLASVATMAGILIFSQPWLHFLLRKIVPAPGQGPSRELMMSGYYEHMVFGETTDGDIITGTFADKHRDPGYWGTSRLLLEAALCLALDKKDLDACPDVLKGGVLTPASALGPILQKRLENADIACHAL